MLDAFIAQIDDNTYEATFHIPLPGLGIVEGMKGEVVSALQTEALRGTPSVRRIVYTVGSGTVP